MSQSIQLQVTQVGLEQSIQAAMKRVSGSAQINLGTNSKQINALSQPLGRITGQADEFSKSMAAANARVLAFGASAGILAGVSKAMSGLVASTIKVEKSLVEINSVLNKTGAELDKFGQDIFKVAKNTGKSFDEVASGALELARQGLNAEDTLARLNDALILSRLSGLDAAQSVEGLTAAFNSFQKSGITTAEILNKVVAVSQKYAVSERDIIEGVKRSASVAQQAGVSFEELAAVITAVQQTTARGGAVIGNSFKTIFARIQRKDVLSDLQNMGVAVTDLQGNVLPALKILENLAGQLNNFSQIEQANIAEKLGGVFQLDKLLAALKDINSEASVTAGALEVMGKAGNSAYQKNIVLNQTLAALLNKVAVNAEQLGAKLGEIGVTDSLKNVLGFFNGLLEGIQKVLGEESGLGDLVRGLVKGLGSFLAGPGLALFGGIILKLSKDLVQFGFASLKTFFGIGKAAQEVKNVEGAISQILAKNVNLQQQLFALEGNRAAQLRVITTALVEQEALLRRSANISSGLAKPLYNVGARAGDTGLRVPPNSADGYMPAVARESKAIKQGVGGARAGDKPVVIPNFNFGGGKKGTMVAHTGEYIVPNFNGSGGTAVFNRRMVKSMGLPSGAKKIGAAGGFVPNFARGTGLGPAGFLDQLDLTGAESVDQVRSILSRKFSVINSSDKALTVGYGNESIYITNDNISKSLAKKSQLSKELYYNSNADPAALMLVPQNKSFDPNALNTKFTKKKIQEGVVFDGFIGGLAGINPNPDDQKFASLTNVDNEIAEALSSSAVNILRRIEPGIEIQPDSLLNPKNILNSVLQEGGAGAFGAFKGALFESIIKLVSKGKSQEDGKLDVDLNQGREALESIFGIKGKNYRFADFKNSLGQKDKFISQVMSNLPVSAYPAKQQRGMASAAGGYIPNFAAQRNVGYLDGDVLSDPRYAATVKEQIAKLGIKGGTAEYHKYLGDLVSQARASGKLKKFTGIYGVPGAGKSTMMFGGGIGPKADAAKGRKTNRIPIITPEDIAKVSEVIDTRASLLGTMRALEGGYLSNVDRMMILSSSTAEEQSEIQRRRNLRDAQIKAGTSATAFGRTAGTSQGASLDSGYIEAMALSILGPDKVSVMGIRPDFKLARKKGSQLPLVESKKIGLAYGAFSPSTKGHAELLKMAEKEGISPENFIAAVSREGGTIDQNDPHSWRTALFPQGFRNYLMQKTVPGANVINASQDLFAGSIPRMLEVSPSGGQRRFIKAQQGSLAFVGSDKTEKDLEKYIKSGYDVRVGDRTAGISGTAAREAIDNLDSKSIAKIFTKGAVEVINQYLPQMKNRSNIFPEIIKRVNSKVDNQLAPIEQALSLLPARKSKTTPPEVAAQMDELREARDKLKKLKQKIPNVMIRRLGKLFPDKYGLPSAADGFIPNFAQMGQLIGSGQESDVFRKGNRVIKYSKGDERQASEKAQLNKAMNWAAAKNQLLKIYPNLRILQNQQKGAATIQPFAGETGRKVIKDKLKAFKLSDFIDRKFEEARSKNPAQPNWLSPLFFDSDPGNFTFLNGVKGDIDNASIEQIFNANKFGLIDMGVLPLRLPDIKKGAAGSLIPNFAGGTPNRALENAKRLLEKLKPLTGVAKTLGFDQFLNAVLPNGISPVEQDLVAKSLEQVIPAAKAGFQNLKKGPAFGVYVSRREMAPFQSILKDLMDLDAGIPLRPGSHVNDPSPMVKGLVKRARIAYRQIKEEARRNIESGAAGGFLPNFASPLQDAVNREMAAGVPASQIYIDKSPALKNAANPMGLMVANRRDEPAGGFQGINRARREGANPMTYGAAGGFVPNYAAGADQYKGMTRSDAIVKAEESLKPKIDEAAKLYNENNQALKDSVAAIKYYKDEIKKLIDTTSDADKAKKAYENKLKNLTNDLDDEKKINSALNKEKQKLKKSQKDLNKELQSEKSAIIAASTNKKGKETLVGGGKVASNTPGGNRDMLGTIFAVQGAMTALAGATEGATSGFGFFANTLGDAASTASTVAFGFSGIGQMLPQFSKQLGVAGLAIGAVTLAYKIGTAYYNKMSGITSAVASSVEMMGKAAEGAAISLNTIGAARKEEIQKRAKELSGDLGYGKFKQFLYNDTSESGMSTSPITYKAQDQAKFQGSIGGVLNNDLRDQYNKVFENALAQQVPEGVLKKAADKIKSDGFITAGEIKSFSAEIADAMEKASKEVNNFLNSIKDNPVISNNLAKMNNQQFTELLDTNAIQGEEARATAAGYSSFKDYEAADWKVKEGFDLKGRVMQQLGMTEREYNKRFSGMTDAQVGDVLTGARTRAKATLTEKEDAIAQAPIKLQKAIQAAQREKLEREAIRGIDQQIAEQRNASAIKLAGIETDLTLSASQRAIKTLEVQAALEKQTAELERQKTIQQKINELSAGIKNDPVLNSDPKNIKIVQDLFNKLKDSPEAQALLTLDKGDSQDKAANKLIEENLKKVSDGKELAKLEGVIPTLATLLIELATAVDSSKQSVVDEEAARQKNVSAQKAQTTIQEQNSRLLREAQNNISAIADNYTMQASRVAGQLRLNPAQQELALARYNATTQETDPKKIREDERRILDEFFQKQVALQTKQSQIEAKAEFMRNLKVEENIIQLNDNTKATIENTNAIIESQRAGSFMAGGVEIPVTYEDSLIDEAKLAIDKNLFGPVNDQVKNCAKVVLQFAKSLGIPTAGANDLANSFQNVGTEIENKQSNLKPGDFLINTRGGGPNSQGGHVGMYLGNGQVLQASQSAFDQNPSTKQQAATVTPYLQNQWTMARRSGVSVQQATAITAGIGKRGYDKAVELSKLADAQAINAEALKYAKALNISGDAATGLAEQIKNVAIRMREIGVEKALAEEEQRLKNMTADAQALQERLALSDARSIKGAMERPESTFTEGMRNGFLQLEADTQDFAYLLGKDIPKMFSDGMSGAINSAIEGTSSLKDALRSAAYEFVKGINQRLMNNLMDKIVYGSGKAAMTGAASGGGIMSFLSNAFSSGGKVTGGSGSKDDVPAMLMGGEYVINKKAVAKYGPQFLEAVNNGTLNGYAQGGRVQRGPQGNFYTPGTFGTGAIQGKRNLLDFATQTGTSGKFDQMVNESSFQAIRLEPESNRLSFSGMRNSPMFEVTQSAKQQAFDLYLQQYNAEQEARRQSKAQKKALTTQLLMLAGSAALGGLGKVAMTGGMNAVKALGPGVGLFDKLKAFSGGLYKGGDIGSGIMGGGLKNLFSGNFGLAYQDKILKALPVSRATGGMIPSTSGIDTVPAMLSGGEFIMNRAAVQNIGAGNLRSMNSGAASLTSEETSKDLNAQLIAKLDELIQVSGSSGDININVSSSGDSREQASTQDGSSQRQQLARQIRDAVLQVIQEEKRIGGTLRR